MSQENVELVVGLPFYAGDVDAVPVVRDPELYAAWVEAVTPLFHEDVESAFPGLLGGGETHTGIEGFATAWVNWLSAWASYRISLTESIDCDNQIVTCYDVLAVPTGSSGEVKLSGADVWTVRDGKIARWEGYGSRAKALKAVGLEE